MQGCVVLPTTKDKHRPFAHHCGVPLTAVWCRACRCDELPLVCVEVENPHIAEPVVVGGVADATEHNHFAFVDNRSVASSGGRSVEVELAEPRPDAVNEAEGPHITKAVRLSPAKHNHIIFVDHSSMPKAWARCRGLAIFCKHLAFSVCDRLAEDLRAAQLGGCDSVEKRRGRGGG